MTANPSYAATWLFVPGSRPDRFVKAQGAGADIVIFDLEDAVIPSDKDSARASIDEHLTAAAIGTAVRINPPGTPWHEADLDLVASIQCPVILPKAEDPLAIASIARRTGTPVIPLIETAAGVMNCAAIAATEGVPRLTLGNADLSTQLGTDPSDRTALLWTRSTLVTVSASAGIAAPIDGVTLSVNEPDLAASDAEHARSLGFGGKLCIHPSQVQPVAAAFSPSANDVAWAKRVVEAAVIGDSVTVVDGNMIDRPVVLRAQSIIAAAAIAEAN